jgi:hypothetical protein
MSGTADVLGTGSKSRRAMLTMASGETPLATRRISAADKLMARLSFEGHRFVVLTKRDLPAKS